VTRYSLPGVLSPTPATLAPTPGQRADASRGKVEGGSLRRKDVMASRDLPGGTYRVGDLELTRVGYGAMQLAGPHVFGPPRDRDAAIAVLRTAVDLGINHIDTSD
jgi:hypothetical protein